MRKVLVVAAFMFVMLPTVGAAQVVPSGPRGVDIDRNEQGYFAACQGVFEHALKNCQMLEECMPGFSVCLASGNAPKNCADILAACVEHLNPKQASSNCSAVAMGAAHECFNQVMD